MRQSEPIKKNRWQTVVTVFQKTAVFAHDIWDHFAQPPLPRMVEWYSPAQLIRTATETFISSILGRHADRRALEAANKEARFYDFSFETYTPREREPIKREAYAKDVVKADPDAREFWIDYVSDLGDGFNSTYAVAYELSQPEISLPIDGKTESLRRGDLLIFGGDEVYPTAHRQQYKLRLIEPYKAAMRDKPLRDPFLFALPGNHDWYDSLSAFIEFFGDADVHSFANNKWRVPQNRSYFAVKLPQKWWLLGVDFQLESDIDHFQIKYFENIVNHYMKPGDRIILCCAEPYWVFEKLDPALVKKNRESNLNLLLEILKTRSGETDKAEEDAPEDKEIALFLAGDLHHYFRVLEKERRAEKTTPEEISGGQPGALPQKKAEKILPDILKITSGGGGAFMHPTHGAIPRSFSDKKYRTFSYPPAQQSWWLGWRNFLFPLYNRSFGFLPAALYCLFSLFFLQALRINSNNREYFFSALNLSEFAQEALKAMSVSPLLCIFFIIILAGCVGFGKAEGNSPLFAFTIGSLHGVAHAITPLGILYWVLVNQKISVANFLLILGANFVGGWVLGSFIVGIYLFIAVNLCAQHPTFGFSSLKIQDWKNFIRMKINLETGALTIYPLGIRRVPRRWNLALNDEGHHAPQQESDLQVELIEGPIVITPDKTHNGGFRINWPEQLCQPKRFKLFRFRRESEDRLILSKELFKRKDLS